jgi:hypothetical protein
MNESLNMKLFRTSVRLCEGIVRLTLKHYILFIFYILHKSHTLPTHCGTELWRNVYSAKYFRYHDKHALLRLPCDTNILQLHASASCYWRTNAYTMFNMFHILRPCVNYVHSIVKYQQLHFGCIDVRVVVWYSGHQHVSATQVAIFRVVKTRIQI